MEPKSCLRTRCLRTFGVLLALGSGLAQAHDDGRYANSPLKPWFESLHSKRGLCCADADGMTLKDVDWDSKDGHYRVFVEGTWWDVPEDAVIKEPNQDGRTIVWPIYVWSESKLQALKIRCFMPGTMI
jgi:hypothetical protein